MSGSPDRTEHRFIAIWTALALALLFAGFAPTFYLRPFATVGPERPLTTMVAVHGALFTGWLALFATQVWLAATGRIARHQSLGRIAPVAIPVLVATAIPVAIANAAKGDDNPVIPADVFLLLPLCEAVFFGMLAFWAWHQRLSPHTHKRLMMFAIAVILGTGTGRLIGGLVGTFLVPVPFILSVWTFDWSRNRRIERKVLAGGLLAIGSYAIPLAFGFTSGWRIIASRLIDGWALLGA